MSQTIAVLGASGLIGRYVTHDLRARGFTVIAVARSFAAQLRDSADDLEIPIITMKADAIAKLISDHGVDIVVNCLGVLQDGPGMDTSSVHRDFTATLLAALTRSARPIHLIHISIPGADSDDLTAFSRTTREAERLIEASRIPATILRPGFVIAPVAYGGSALLRALAATPIDLPRELGARPFQPVAAADIAETIAWLALHATEQSGCVTWDLMQPEPTTLHAVIDGFRRWLGTARWRRVPLPNLLLDAGTWLGDLVARLGWTPPVRSTAIAELRRGVTGDPAAWVTATGIAPRRLAQAIGPHPATIQDKWFARLFLVKPVIIASLAVFWIVSGFIALFISYDAAAAILRAHHFPPALVDPITVGTSLMDMSIGALIACRRSSAAGLCIGIVASLGYMFGAAVLTPDLWIEPLGALVKTGPAIVLMLVALMMLDNR